MDVTRTYNGGPLRQSPPLTHLQNLALIDVWLEVTTDASLDFPKLRIRLTTGSGCACCGYSHLSAGDVQSFKLIVAYLAPIFWQVLRLPSGA
jgi:hypothetical protein